MPALFFIHRVGVTGCSPLRALGACVVRTAGCICCRVFALLFREKLPTARAGRPAKKGILFFRMP